MPTISDCLGQRILCYVDYSERAKPRVYPQYVIDRFSNLIYITDELRKSLTGGKGYLIALQNTLDKAYPIIEIKNFRYAKSQSRKYSGEFMAYGFVDCYLCIDKSDYKSEDLLKNGSCRVKADFLPLVECDIFIRCKDAIVGPFAYEYDGENVHVKGSSGSNNVISWYRPTALQNRPFAMGKNGKVELILRKVVYSTVPILKKEYVKSAYSSNQGEQIGGDCDSYREENESLKKILKKFNLVDDETQRVNIKDFEQRLYLVDAKLISLERIRKGQIQGEELIDDLKKNIQQREDEKRALQLEIERLQEKQRERDNVTSRQKNELLEIEEKVGQALENKVASLQRKIDEYKTVAGGLSSQVTQNLRGKILELISSVSIAEASTVGVRASQTEQQDAREPEKQYRLPVIQFNSDLQDAALGKKIIERVQGYLAAKNRFCSVADVANFLVCLTQGFMTTFAGNPGSGKTSLSNLLAKALGLVAEHDGTHFVDVPVSRGWTSAKDFIGYYNPLAKQMVRSNAAVYKALELSEQEDSGEVPPMVILLDEANLSPLEHYWSSFLKNSDFSSSSARSFSLGGDKVWKINPHLRFLATVNHDHTTEELSPRFLDRSWVILLDGQSSEVDVRDIDIPDISGDWAAVPYAKLEEAFGVAAHSKLPMKPEVLQLWTAIRAAMQESQMRIMPRNVNMVENYVKAASLYMSDTFMPLDYAMAQKILPTLSGSGERMKTCLTELHRKCDGKLPRTASLLARMLEAGKHNMEMYQFFVQ